MNNTSRQEMYHILGFILLAALCVPAVASAQTTGDVDSMLPPDYQPEPQQLEGDLKLASSSASTSSEKTEKKVETTLRDLQEIVDSEKIEHERISVNFGLRHRFGKSPGALLDSHLSPQIVFNQQLLELYLGQEVLQKHIRMVSVDEEEITFQVKGRSKLLGVIPMLSWYDVSAELDPGELNLSMGYPNRWYGFLVSVENSDVRAQQATAVLENRRFLSRLQLAAAIVDVSRQVLAGSDIQATASSTPRG